MSGGSSGFERARAFEQISGELLRVKGEHPTLERTTQLAAATIEGCDECGISIRYGDGTVATPVFTSPLVAKTEALQYEFGQGPCLDAIWELDTYLIDDLETETRWPRWAPAAVELGFRSILSVRLHTPQDTLGGLNLYAHTPHAFDQDDVMIASIFARHASNALTVARHNDGLNTALQTRQAIGVAQGMLMQRYGLTLDQSFEVLRRYSNDNNIRLRALAEQLILAGRITNDLDDTLG